MSNDWRTYAAYDVGSGDRNERGNQPARRRHAKPTFTKDVAPILQQNCQTCHRPGEAAPFSLLTYEQARPWAKAIKAAVLQKKMPPWFADPQFGKFSNDRPLSQSDINTLVAWVDAGAPSGRSQGHARAQAIRRGLDDSQAGHRLPTAQALPRAGDRRDGVSVRHHPHRLHQGHLGGAGTGRADQPQRGPPHRGLRAHPGLQLLQGHAEERVLRGAPGQEGRRQTRRRTTCRTTG